MKKILLAALFSLLSLPAFATQYYIDYNGSQGVQGSDSNAGTTTSTPWKTCTNAEATSFLKPGDILSIANGNDIVGADAHCDIASAGLPNSHITINNWGTGSNPIFDASVNVTSTAGWTGWTIYYAIYTFTVTSANATAGAVYTDGTYNFTVNTTISSGTTLVTHGVNAPSGSTLTKVSGTGDTTITFSNAVATQTIYVSNTTISFPVANVAIDGSYSLRRCVSESTLQTDQDAYYQVSGGLLYVQLSDNSSPAGHSVQVGEYGPSSRGIVRTDDLIGRYIDFENLTIQGAYNMGFSSSGPYVTVTNVTSQFNGREGFYFLVEAAQNNTGAAYNVCTGCVAQYNNGYFTGSAGQGITIEAPHVDLISTTSQFNWMAGIDFLNYYGATPPTNATDDRCINCLMHNNSMRAWNGDGGGFDPPCIYIDGGNGTQIINSVCYTDGVLVQAGTNSITGIYIGNEDPVHSTVSNIDIVNSLVYGINYFDIGGGAINCTGGACDVFNNIRIVGCTIAYGGFQQVGLPGMVVGGNWYFYNNVLLKTAGSTFGIGPGWFNGVQGHYNAFMDYNTYYNGATTNIWDVGYGAGSYTLSQWQTLSGQDLHSQFANPLVTGSGYIGGITQSYHLSSTAAGQGSNSPALGFAIPNYLGSQYVFSSIGTVRTDSVVDNTNAPADGYHYLANFQSSSFVSTQNGTDYY